MTANLKTSFYKTLEERLLAHAVDSDFNSLFGGAENHYLDTGETTEVNIENYKADLVNELLGATCPIECEVGDDYYYLEPKHIRFMGRARVTEIVNHRVDYRLSKDNSVGVVLK